MLVVVFALSMFVSAALLFLVEPMMAKMMLPTLGGSPAVWNTCLVFFQAVLLAGYLYAHASMRWLGRKAQVAVHMFVMFLPLFVAGILPLHLPTNWAPPTQSNPAPWILAILLVSAGLPFFALASSTPLMQKWFAASRHEHAADPYFLYSASNAGSLVGLLMYPLLLEPLLSLRHQSRGWAYVYVLFAVMTSACAFLGFRMSAAGTALAQDASPSISPRVLWIERLRWVGLAFIPSSLMLGVTTALTTDMPAIPLLWVVPLALYLVSFVLVFAKRPPISHEWLIRRLPLLLLCALIPVMSQTRIPLLLTLLLDLVMLWAVAMVCHGELARSRPAANRLTEFYLWMSVGGVLGGIFNSLIAPVIFNSVWEFPLVLVLAALVRPPIDVEKLTGSAAIWARRKDWMLPFALGICMLTVILGLRHMGIHPGRPLTILIFGYSAVWCLSFGKRPLRFAAGLAAMLLASSFFIGTFGRALDTERSFFGVLRVTNDPTERYRYLIHGGTAHGIQSLDPAREREPLAYYTRSGPAGQIVKAAQTRMPHGNWAIVGLGAGSMACYLQPGQTLTYYEIDPLDVRLAKNPRYFTFLQQCAPQAAIVLGDARMRLRDAPDAYYGLIVLDAFSGDTIPMHLLTREALALYRRKLAPGGILAFHTSNRYVQLVPTLGNLASDAHLVPVVEEDDALTQADADAGKFGSEWVVMAASDSDLATLVGDKTTPLHWVPVQGRPGARVWTDDYSNLLSVVRLK